MLFFFKEKPIEITAFISEKYQYVNTLSPIVPAKQMFPEWWKKIPSSSFNWATFGASTTVKSCPGIINMLSAGYIMPLWCDIAIECERERYRIRCSDDTLPNDIHDPRQSPGLFENYFHLKLNSPWVLKTPVNLMFATPSYQFASPLPYTVMPGIAPPIGGYSATHVFVFIEKKDKTSRIMIKQKTPMIQIIPLTEKTIKLKTEVVTDETMEIMKRSTGLSHFYSRGLRMIHANNKKK